MIDLKNLDRYNVDSFIKDIFIGTLQEIFYANEGEFKWDPDPKATIIEIKDRFSYDNLTADSKPCIYIRRLPINPGNLVLNQMSAQNLNTGDTSFVDMMNGAVELVSVSSQGLEAARLASQVFIVLQAVKESIRQLGLYDVRVGSLGGETIREAGATTTVVEVPVMVTYMFSLGWMTDIMNSQILNEISLGRTDGINQCSPMTDYNKENKQCP